MMINHTYSQVLLTLLFMFATPLSFSDPVWIDVRSALEYQIDHIEGDKRFAYDDIVIQVQGLYPDKATEIQLYCRSGGRAAKAKEALEAAGYTAIHNAGGIDDARKIRALE